MIPSLDINRSVVDPNASSLCHEPSLSFLPDQLTSKKPSCHSLHDKDHPPSSIHFQDSLILLISRHLSQRLFNSCLMSDCRDRPRCCIRPLITKLSLIFETYGYISHRLFESSVSAMKIFFSTSTFPILLNYLPILSSAASLFRAEVSSIYLVDYSSLGDVSIGSNTSIITGLHLDWNSNDIDFFNDSSPRYLPNLRYLQVVDYSQESFPSLCRALVRGTNIKELEILIAELTVAQFADLAEVFSTSETLKTVRLGFLFVFYPDLEDETLSSLFTALSKNTIINLIDLRYFYVRCTDVILPLLNTTTLKRLVFPCGRMLGSLIFQGLQSNSSIRDVCFNDNQFKTDDLCEYLMLNTCLKKLELFGCTVTYSTFFKCLENNTSLLELSITFTDTVSIADHGSGMIIEEDSFDEFDEPLVFKIKFDDDDVQALSSMIQKNSTLRVLSLQEFPFESSHVTTVVKALESNSVLQKVGAHDLNNSIDFENLIPENRSM
ncbi:hypothetical protein GEMRC1_000447 [Eukaryota sp. GEM-RC1]